MFALRIINSVISKFFFIPASASKQIPAARIGFCLQLKETDRRQPCTWCFNADPDFVFQFRHGSETSSARCLIDSPGMKVQDTWQALFAGLRASKEAPATWFGLALNCCDCIFLFLIPCILNFMSWLYLTSQLKHSIQLRVQAH